MRSRKINAEKTEKIGRERLSVPQTLLLLTLMVGVFIVLIFFFRGPVKGEDNSIQTVASILEVLVAIMIIVGFEVMLQIQSAVSKWYEDLKQVDERLDKLEDFKEDVIKSVVPRLDRLEGELETSPISAIIWPKGRFHELFSISAQLYGHIVEKYIQEHELRDFEEAIMDSFHRAWLFSNTASDLFRPMTEPERIEEDKNAVLNAIDFLYNQTTRPALRVLRIRKEVARRLIERLANKQKELEEKKEKEGFKASEELEMVKMQLDIEFEIYEKLTKVIDEMDEELK